MHTPLHSDTDGHPDLRPIIAAALDAMQTDAPPDAPDDVRLVLPISTDDLIIRCQRTWHDVACHDARVAGSSLSSCVVQFTNNSRLQSFFFTCVRPAGSGAWHARSWGGGPIPQEREHQAGGCHRMPGSYLIVGGIGIVPAGGILRAAMGDGTVYEDRCQDGCASVFAPVISQPTAAETVTVRYLDANGNELGAEQHWLGDGISRRP